MFNIYDIENRIIIQKNYINKLYMEMWTYEVDTFTFNILMRQVNKHLEVYGNLLLERDEKNGR